MGSSSSNDIRGWEVSKDVLLTPLASRLASAWPVWDSQLGRSVTLELGFLVAGYPGYPGYLSFSCFFFAAPFPFTFWDGPRPLAGMDLPWSSTLWPRDPGGDAIPGSTVPPWPLVGLRWDTLWILPCPSWRIWVRDPSWVISRSWVAVLSLLKTLWNETAPASPAIRQSTLSMIYPAAALISICWAYWSSCPSWFVFSLSSKQWSRTSLH